MKSFLPFFLFFVFSQVSKAVTIVPSAKATKVGEFLISADSMVSDLERNSIELDGNVQIILKDEHVSAQKARINTRLKTIDAIGDVVVVGSVATVSGYRILLDYENNSGIIYEGYVQSGNVIFQGSIIQKTGPNEFISEDSLYTACSTCPEAWSLSGKKIKAELGGYAYIKNALVRFAGVPFLWLPYIVIPLKSDRQSGFLPPEFASSSRGGLEFNESFFWAINRSQDATITLNNYELRGPKGLLNYRYVLDPKSHGELDTSYLGDRVFSKEERYNNFQSNKNSDSKNRWFVRYSHYHELPNNYVHRAQFNNVSDLQYPTDFPDETKNYGDSSLDSRTSISKNTENQHYSVDASYYKNLLQSDPVSNNNSAVHRIPEFRFSQTQTRLGKSRYFFEFDLQYVNFARSNFAYDDLNAAYNPNSPNDQRFVDSTCNTNQWDTDPNCQQRRDGFYDPKKDLIRTGQRIHFSPSISRPFQLGQFVDVVPKLSYFETQYYFNVGDERQNIRRYMKAEVSGRTTLSSIIGQDRPIGESRYKHEIQPELNVSVIPFVDHPSHPFFGANTRDEAPFSSQENLSDADINGPYGLQFDYLDRVYDRKLMTFALTNKLTRKSWQNDIPSYKQTVHWRLAQSYDLYQAEKNFKNRQTFSDLSSELNVTMDYFDLYHKANYFPEQRVTNSYVSVRVSNERGEMFQVDHRFFYTISPGKLVSFNERTDEYSVLFKKETRWADFSAKVIYNNNPEEKKPWLKSFGYGVIFKFPGECLYVNLVRYQTTGGDSREQVNFFFSWDGQTKPNPTESILNRQVIF